MKNKKIGLRFAAIAICMLVMASLSMSVCGIFAHDTYSRSSSFEVNNDGRTDNYGKDGSYDGDSDGILPYTEDGDLIDPDGNDTTTPDTDDGNDTILPDNGNDGGIDKEDAKPDDDANIADEDDKNDKDDDGVKDGKKISYTGLIVAVIIAVAVIILIIVMIPTMKKSNGSKR